MGTLNARGKLLSLKCSARSTTVEVCGLGDGNAMLPLSLSVPPGPPSPCPRHPPWRGRAKGCVGEYSGGGVGGLDGHCIVRHNDAFYSSRNSYASSATFRPRALLKRAFEGKNLGRFRPCPRARAPLFATPDRGVRAGETPVAFLLILSSFLPSPLAWPTPRPRFPRNGRFKGVQLMLPRGGTGWPAGGRASGEGLIPRGNDARVSNGVFTLAVPLSGR